MKILILGASGGCGQQLVKLAVERGHTVTAAVRPSSPWKAPAGLRVVQGELGDAAFLEQALSGQEAVLSGLGLRLPGLAPWSQAEVPDLLSRTTPVLVAAMKAAGVSRLVAVSAGGVGDSRDKVPAFFRFFVQATALRHAYVELEKMESLLLGSGLDVCLPRPTGLTDGPLTGEVKVCQSFSGRATISRADVAAFMLDEVVKPTFEHRTPMISVTGIS